MFSSNRMSNVFVGILTSVCGALIVAVFGEIPYIGIRVFLLVVFFLCFYLVCYRIQQRLMFPRYSKGTIRYNSNINADKSSFPDIFTS